MDYLKVIRFAPPAAAPMRDGDGSCSMLMAIIDLDNRMLRMATV